MSSMLTLPGNAAVAADGTVDDEGAVDDDGVSLVVSWDEIEAGEYGTATVDSATGVCTSYKSETV